MRGLRALRGGGLAALLALAAACAHRGPSPGTEAPGAEPAPEGAVSPPEVAPPPEGAQPTVEIGLASFYAKRFHGRRTASGARYDMHAMTCAHPTAPFGTRLRVTELEGGRSVEVTVTDRGPFARGRVVDLSLAAAKKLGMVAKGLVRVRVERVDAPEG